MKQVAGVWLPDDETHLIKFLEDPKTQVGGVGTYQRKKLEAALRYIPEDRRQTAVDVGAHVGLWAAPLSKLFHSVEAFEPVPEHLKCLARNLEGVANVTVWPYALGDGSGEGMVYLEPESAESSGGFHVSRRRTPIPAPSSKLDYFHFWTLDFVKIDVEGYELFVVQGGEVTLRTHRPVICIEQKEPRAPGDRADRYGIKTLEALTLLEQWGAKVRESLSGDYIVSW